MHHYGSKRWIVEEIAKKTGLTKSQAQTAVDAFANTVMRGMKEHGKANLPGFGTFSVVGRKARTGRNPVTGGAIKIPATKIPKFKAGKGLRDAVRGKK